MALKTLRRWRERRRVKAAHFVDNAAARHQSLKSRDGKGNPHGNMSASLTAKRWR